MTSFKPKPRTSPAKTISMTLSISEVPTKLGGGKYPRAKDRT